MQKIFIEFVQVDSDLEKTEEKYSSLPTVEGQKRHLQTKGAHLHMDEVEIIGFDEKCEIRRPKRRRGGQCPSSLGRSLTEIDIGYKFLR